MSVNGIGIAGSDALRPLGEAGTPVGGGTGAEDVGGGFAEMLAGLGETTAQADRAMADLAVGGERDLHDVVLAVEMESVAFDLAVQVRNRLVDAYSEIFRMQV